MEKASRVLMLFYRLLQKEHLHKANIAIEYNTTERSIDRDIKTIRLVLDDLHTGIKLGFDKKEESYYLFDQAENLLTGREMLLLLKVLLGSRVLCKSEMKGLIDSLRTIFPKQDKYELISAIKDEIEQYVEPVHKQAIMKMQWDLQHCIIRREQIVMQYIKGTGEPIERLVLPVGIIFSEFYFYLVAFIAEKSYQYPAFFRLDRISSFVITGEQYSRRLYEQYSVGKLRECVQFMYAGELTKVTLRCKPNVVEAVRDRLPNHQIIGKEGDDRIIKAKIFGEGFLRWVLMQQERVEVLEPEYMREQMKQSLEKITNIYKK